MDGRVEALRLRDAERARESLSRHGLAIIEGVLDAGQVRQVREALERGIAADRARGTPLSGFAFDPDHRNTRVFDLIGKDQVFRDLVQHELAVALVRHLLGGKFLLSNFSANITAPGSGAMGMHADQGYVPAPWPPYPLAVNVAWALDDFTVENGATRYVPGSHRSDRGPDPSGEHPQAVPIECPAGSIFVMDGRVWHQTGANVSAGSHRAGLFAYYVRPFLRPQWNWHLTLDPRLVAQASPLLREMLGYGSNPTGNVHALYLRDGPGEAPAKG